MPQVILDFNVTEVYNAEAGRRKLGLVGVYDPTADVVLHSLQLLVPLGVGSGGTGLNHCGRGDLLVGDPVNTWKLLPAGPYRQVLTSMGPGQVPEYRPAYLPVDFFDGIVTAHNSTVRTAGGEPVWSH